MYFYPLLSCPFSEFLVPLNEAPNYLDLILLSSLSSLGEWLLHPSGRVQGGQSRFTNSAQLPHVQDVLLSIWWNAGEERSSNERLLAESQRQKLYTPLHVFDNFFSSSGWGQVRAREKLSTEYTEILWGLWSTSEVQIMSFSSVPRSENNKQLPPPKMWNFLLLYLKSRAGWQMSRRGFKGMPWGAPEVQRGRCWGEGKDGGGIWRIGGSFEVCHGHFWQVGEERWEGSFMPGAYIPAVDAARPMAQLRWENQCSLHP